jgi:hypothetical protein
MSTAVKTEAISLPTFTEFVFEHIQNNKKMNTRECFLIWLETHYNDLKDNTDRPSLRDSIDWSYEEKGSEALQAKKISSELIVQRLQEIVAKEANSKIKALIKKYIKSFEDSNSSRGQKNAKTKLPEITARNAKKSEKKQGREVVEEDEIRIDQEEIDVERRMEDAEDKKSLLNYSLVSCV